MLETKLTFGVSGAGFWWSDVHMFLVLYPPSSCRLNQMSTHLQVVYGMFVLMVRPSLWTGRAGTWWQSWRGGASPPAAAATPAKANRAAARCAASTCGGNTSAGKTKQSMCAQFPEVGAVWTLWFPLRRLPGAPEVR